MVIIKNIVIKAASSFRMHFIITMLLVILSLILFLSIIYFRWNKRQFFKLAKILKHDILTLPVIGIVHIFFGNNEAIMKGFIRTGEEALKQDGLFGCWFAHNFIVFVADPEIAEFVSKTCLDKHDIMKKCFGNIFGNANIVASVPIWRLRRKIAKPLFTLNNLKEYMRLFTTESSVLVEKLRPTVGKPVFIMDHFYKYSLETLSQVTVGVELDVQSCSSHPILIGMENISQLVGHRFTRPWLHHEFVYKLMPVFKNFNEIRELGYKFVDQAIKTKRAQTHDVQTDQKSYKSFLEMLITITGDDQGYNDLELREELLIFFVAGMDTSAVTSAFCVLMLARFPHIQEKVYEELKIVFHDNSRSVEAQDLPRLKYLEAVIKETLRLFPPVPVVVRQADKDVTLPSGVSLPKGTGIVLHLWAINRNPKYWGDDAEVFRPERFLQSELKHPAQFAPFSLGPRNCVGGQFAIMSIKTVLSTVIRHYQVLPATTFEGRPEDVRLTYNVTIKDVDNFPVVLQPRKF